MVLQSAFNFRRTKGSSPWGLVEVYQLVYFANGFSSPAAVTGKGGDSLIKGKAGWAVSDAAASLRNGLAQTVICGSQYFWARASRHLKEQGKKKKRQLKTRTRSLPWETLRGGGRSWWPREGLGGPVPWRTSAPCCGWEMVNDAGTIGTDSTKRHKTLAERTLPSARRACARVPGPSVPRRALQL